MFFKMLKIGIPKPAIKQKIELSGLDIRIVVNHPQFSEAFVKIDTKMTEHLAEQGTNKKVMAFFKANRARNEDINEVLIPLEFD
jgi:hypothetical protein